MSDLPPDLADDDIISSLAAAVPTTWIRTGTEAGPGGAEERHTDIAAELPELASAAGAAAQRFERFAPWFAETFPEAATPEAPGIEMPGLDMPGIIESPLTRADAAQKWLDAQFGTRLSGQLWLKRDDHLAVSGSIKARGGFHEVLEYAEAIAAENGLEADDHAIYSGEEFRRIAGTYRIVVGSTGNLGLSIGILSAALGFAATVHMSADARAWKKEKLRDHGVEVIEHDGDFVEAVEAGRASAMGPERTHFVDDEDSISLFAGYSVAAERLKRQIVEAGVTIDSDSHLVVYLPCGIGGGPGGVTFGLKRVFGDNVHGVFVEPSQAPAMFLGVRSGLHSGIAVQDIGLSGATAADGLAVARPSRFIGPTIGPLISGFASVPDEVIKAGVGVLHETEGIDVEPSATAGLTVPWRTGSGSGTGPAGGHDEPSAPWPKASVHLVWLTGGAMVPADEMRGYVTEGLELAPTIAHSAQAVFREWAGTNFELSNHHARSRAARLF